MDRLVTIPVSHYCERARWALEHAGVAYHEERHLQMFHRKAVRRAGGGLTVPVLVTPQGTLSDSAEIVAYADARAEPDRRLYPRNEESRRAVVALEQGYAADLGVEARRWLYHRLLPQRRLLLRYNGQGAPAFQRAALRMAFPAARRTLVRYLNITDETAARAFEAITACFDEIASRLSDGRRYLCGDTFSAADLTFASLAAIAVLPSQYGARLPPVDALRDSTRREVEGFRDHPAGQFALRLYRDHRRPGSMTNGFVAQKHLL